MKGTKGTTRVNILSFGQLFSISCGSRSQPLSLLPSQPLLPRSLALPVPNPLYETRRALRGVKEREWSEDRNGMGVGWIKGWAG